MWKDEERIQTQRARKKKTRNLFFGFFFFFFIGGYLFFFTSKLWMPDTGEASRVTAMFDKLDWNNREIELIRWDYSPEQKLMEVELGITNKQFDGMNTYLFSALESSGRKLDVQPVIEEPEWVILHIKDVPKRFQEISLRLELSEDEDAGMVRLYTNRNDVNRVVSIEKKTQKEYMIARLDAEVKGYQNAISELEVSITDEQSTIVTIQDEIYRLEAKQAYQTEQEIEITDALIVDAKSEIESAKQRVEGYQQEIEEYQKRIQNLQENEEKMKRTLR